MFCCVDKNRRPNARGTIVSHSFASRSASLRARAITLSIHHMHHPARVPPSSIVDRPPTPDARRSTRRAQNPTHHPSHPTRITLPSSPSSPTDRSRFEHIRRASASRARIQSSHPSPVRPARALATSITHRGLEQFIVVLTRARGDGALGASRGRLRDDSRAGERGGGRRGEHRGKVTPRSRSRRGSAASAKGTLNPQIHRS